MTKKFIEGVTLTDTRAALSVEFGQAHLTGSAAGAVFLVAHVALTALDQHALADQGSTQCFIAGVHSIQAGHHPNHQGQEGYVGSHSEFK